MLRDPALWLLTLLGAAVGALYGLRFGPSIGESPLVGSVALGIMGVGPGFVAGVMLAWVRRRSRQRTAAASARERFVAELNASEVDRRRRYVLSASDPRALVLEFEDERHHTLDPESRATLNENIARRIREMLDQDDAGLAAELRQHGFSCWVVRMNGATLLEHPID